MSEFYCYRHIRPDTNQPFYIGIGAKKETKEINLEYKRAYDFNKRTKFWLRVFEKCNKQIDVEIIYETDSWDYAKEKEKEFIQLYGRRDLGNGTLVNMTDGGDGVLGGNPSEETRKKISDGLKGKKHSPEHIEAFRISNAGKKATVETKAKMSKARLGKKHSLESRQKMSKAQTGKKRAPTSDETKLKMSLAGKGRPSHRKGKTMSEEACLNMSKAQTGRKHTEETKKKMSLVDHVWRRGKKASEETRLKMSLARMGNTNTKGKKGSEQKKAKMRQIYLNNPVDPITGRFQKKR